MAVDLQLSSVALDERRERGLLARKRQRFGRAHHRDNDRRPARNSSDSGGRRHQGQQQVRPGVDRHGPAEHLGRAISRIVVQEGPRAAELVTEGGQPVAARLRVLVVAAPNRQREAVARREARWTWARSPCRARRSRPARAAASRRACGTGRYGQSERRVELAVRGPQPALARRACAGRSRPGRRPRRPSGSKTRSTRKRSASVVLDETNSFAADGPVISVSRSRARRGR